MLVVRLDLSEEPPLSLFGGLRSCRPTQRLRISATQPPRPSLAVSGRGRRRFKLGRCGRCRSAATLTFFLPLASAGVTVLICAAAAGIFEVRAPPLSQRLPKPAFSPFWAFVALPRFRSPSELGLRSAAAGPDSSFLYALGASIFFSKGTAGRRRAAASRVKYGWSHD